MQRRLIIGDIHAEYYATREVLDRASFDTNNDTLYSVGDFVDRGAKPIETLTYLMSLPDFRPVLGNHDSWLEAYLQYGRADYDWRRYNGGDITRALVSEQPEEWLEKLKRWLNAIPLLRVEEKDIIIHGGIPGEHTVKELENVAKRTRPLGMPALSPAPFNDDNVEDLDYLESFYWDRSYIRSAQAHGNPYAGDYGEPRRPVPPVETDKTIWIGHSPQYETMRPYVNEQYHLVCVDTGAVNGIGKITVMDMDTREYWQSDVINPEHRRMVLDD